MSFRILSGVIALAVSVGWSVSAVPSEAVVISDTELRARPRFASPAKGKLKSGVTVKILSRKGAFYQVPTSGGKRWVSVFALRSKPFESTGPESHRELSIRSKAAVMGVRGLDAGTMQQAEPDWEQFGKVASFAEAAGNPGNTNFARYGGRRLNAVIMPAWRFDVPMSEEDEKESVLGRRVAAQLLGAAPLVPKESIQVYVNRVGKWLSRFTDRPQLEWRFGVVRSRSINAFAVPGGWVFVTSALYRELESEAELAAVLAHEIHHIVSRHHFKLLIQGMALEEGMKRVIFPHPAIKAAMKEMMTTGAAVFSRALDQSAERDADRHAAVLLADAGYDPYAFAQVLQIIEARTAASEDGEMLLETHPSPSQRLEALSEFGHERFISLTGRLSLAARFRKHGL